MSLEKTATGWRARRKKGDTTFNGPTRTTEAAANEDKQQLEEAAAVSMDRLREVHARLRRGARPALPAPSVSQHGSEQLPDEEALQQDNTSTSAMRVKRSVDCLLSAPAATGGPSRVKLRCAGPASAVAWLLRGNVGEAHFVVLAHTSDAGEWSVLWHVPVEAHRVQGVKNFMLRIYE